jgi:hypothetical protein
MARPGTSPATRLKALEQALAKAQALPRRATLTSVPMAELLAVSWPTLRDWCNDIPALAAAKAFERGDRGIEWTFRPVATVKALIKHFGAERAKRAARARRVKAIVGGTAFDGADDDFSIDELGKMIRLSTDLQNAKERAGQLTDADRAASAITTLLSNIQQAVLRAAQEEDQTGQWPPEIRESFENATRRILLRIEQSGQDCLRNLRGSAAQPG